MNTTPAEETLDMHALAKLLDVHPNTIRHWDKAGRLKPDHRVGRGDRLYYRSTVDAFIAANTAPTDMLTAANISTRYGIRLHTVRRALESKRVQSQAVYRNEHYYAPAVIEWLAGVMQWEPVVVQPSPEPPTA